VADDAIDQPFFFAEFARSVSVVPNLGIFQFGVQF
jgi:hypothetical protein